MVVSRWSNEPCSARARATRRRGRCTREVAAASRRHGELNRRVTLRGTMLSERGLDQRPTTTDQRLFLEKIIERRPSILRLQSRRRRRLFLHHHANRVRRTLVPHIFSRHAFFHRLHALKAARRIEIHALFARVQLESALGTSAQRLAQILQHRPALRAARHVARSRHLDRPRTKRIFLRRTRSLRLFELRFLSAVLISALAIFSV